jgi:type IV pilus assembly protein PilW
MRALIVYTRPCGSISGGQTGFSLVELMVAMLVGLLLLAGVGTMVVNSSAAHRELNEAGRQAENGRYAMQLLADEIHHAGYFGDFFDLPSPPGALPNPCATDVAGLQAAMPLPMQGYDAPAAPPAPLSGCLPDADHLAGTDILVLRRASTAATALASLENNEMYMQATGNSVILAVGPEPTPATPAVFTLTQQDGVTAADTHKYRVDIYYISPCTEPAVTGGSCDASADGGTPVPALKRVSLMRNPATGNLAMLKVPLVAGIENMQIDYGVDNDGDGIPNLYSTCPTDTIACPDDTSAWADIVALEVRLLARNILPSAGYIDTKSYNMGLMGNFAPASANFKRHVFAAQIRAVNPASRREVP